MITNNDVLRMLKPVTGPSIMSIGKIPDRQKGDPDYVILGKENWNIWVYPHKISCLDNRFTNFTKREPCLLVAEVKKPLYDLLDTAGSPTSAMLYIQLLDRWHPHYKLEEFVDLSSSGMVSGMVKCLIHMILYEPHKINWVDGEGIPWTKEEIKKFPKK